MHKITSLEDCKRKILRQKFGSHGTSLGSMGFLSQGDLGLGSGRLQFLVIWGPYDLPILVASHGTAKSLKAARSQCDVYMHEQHKSIDIAIECQLIYSEPYTIGRYFVRIS